jgi:hypothetical protein
VRITGNSYLHENYKIGKNAKTADSTDFSGKVSQAIARKAVSVRNATFEEFSSLSLQLYEAGQISLLDHATLTFNPNKSPQSVKPLNYFVTQAEANGRRDWVVEFQTRAVRDLRMNDMQGYERDNRLSGILDNVF